MAGVIAGPDLIVGLLKVGEGCAGPIDLWNSLGDSSARHCAANRCPPLKENREDVDAADAARQAHCDASQQVASVGLGETKEE